MSVLVAGANRPGGVALCKSFANVVRGGGRHVIRSLRLQRFDVEDIEICSLQSKMNWTAELKSVQQVGHMAAREHARADKSADPLSKLRCTTVDETVSLARQAAATSLRRFTSSSTIKVNGEFTAQGCPLSVAGAPVLEDSFGVSEQEAEGELHLIAMVTGIDVVIIYPLQVYGPGVGASIDSMMRRLVRGILLLQKNGAVPLHWIIGSHRSSLA